jgi:hypothetical protein
MVAIIKKKLVVPQEIIVEVAGIICNNQLTHEIIEADDEEDIIILEVQYTKKERDAIHEIEDLIADNVDEEDDEEDDE